MKCKSFIAVNHLLLGLEQDLGHSFSQYGPLGRQITYMYYFKVEVNFCNDWYATTDKLTGKLISKNSSFRIIWTCGHAAKPVCEILNLEVGTNLTHLKYN